MVSSVTYITSSPRLRARRTACSVVRSRKSRSQPSAYCRMGLLPKNRAASRATPERCWASAMATMSGSAVRPAQLGRMGSLAWSISRARATTSASARGLLPGYPMSARWIPSSAIRCRISFFSSTVGCRTDGLCSPSRRVSSLSSTGNGGFPGDPGPTFQS